MGRVLSQEAQCKMETQTTPSHSWLKGSDTLQSCLLTPSWAITAFPVTHLHLPIANCSLMSKQGCWECATNASSVLVLGTNSDYPFCSTAPCWSLFPHPHFYAVFVKPTTQLWSPFLHRVTLYQSLSSAVALLSSTLCTEMSVCTHTPPAS